MPMPIRKPVWMVGRIEKNFNRFTNPAARNDQTARANPRINGCGPAEMHRLPLTKSIHGRFANRNRPEKDQPEAAKPRKISQGQLQGFRGRVDRKGRQVERQQWPSLPAPGLGGQARQNHSYRLMQKLMYA